MKTSKILSSALVKEWGSGANLTYFHSVTLEGEPKAYNIGAKKPSPEWLQPGQSLDWEFKDEAKGSIKKAVKPFGGQASQTQTPAVGLVPPDTTLDFRISVGLKVATDLYIAGKITKDQVNEIAANVVRKFDEIKASL